MKKIILSILTVLMAWNVKAQKNFQLNINKIGTEISPSMWGVFFEDINFGADGGIYAELVKNRSFEFTKPWMGWDKTEKPFVEGQIQIKNNSNNPNNPRYISLKVNHVDKGQLGLTNEGFRGMGLKKNLAYDFSTFYRVKSGTVKLHVELLNERNEVIGGVESQNLKASDVMGSNWDKLELAVNSNETVYKGKMRIWFTGTGEIDLDIVSLFPTDTWMGRKGGMRADMVQKLAELKPGFIRFPGGCIVEGIDLNNRYQWKRTIGPIEDRQLIMNRWNVEFAHKSTPDYFQTFGLGFFEYFQLAEDIGAEPLPILNCGMACQFNTAELVELEDIGPYVQDALDLIEFANGDINTLWGRKRAEMGHPQPFNLKYIGVGNENWGPQYVERLAIFQKAIKAKYPSIKIIASAGTGTDGERFEFLDKELRSLNVDIIDEHSYRPPSWFLSNASRYDNYDRKGPEIFVGEWASHTKNQGGTDNVNNWEAALSESAFMTGLERNADIVTLSSYAPLFAHIDAWQWSPDLIWVDNLNVYGTPSYYVQKMFSTNHGTHTLNLELDGKTFSAQDSVYASAVINKKTQEVIIKITNASSQDLKHSVQLHDVKKLNENVILQRMKSDDLEAMNSFANVIKVAPVESTIKLDSKKKVLNLELPSRSFSVYKIKISS